MAKKAKYDVPGLTRSQAACRSKRAFRERRHASEYRRKVKKRQGAVVWVYFCGECGRWHVTGKRVSERQALKDRERAAAWKARGTTGAGPTDGEAGGEGAAKTGGGTP